VNLTKGKGSLWIPMAYSFLLPFIGEMGAKIPAYSGLQGIDQLGFSTSPRNT